MAARKYAKILLQADCCLYSQHIADTFLPRVSQSPELPKPITHYTRISIPKLIANSHLYHPSWWQERNWFLNSSFKSRPDNLTDSRDIDH